MTRSHSFALVDPVHALTPPGNSASVAAERVGRVIGAVYASLSARTCG